VGQNSIHISECGYKIKRKPERPLALA
jgi:hypothetical protein